MPLTRHWLYESELVRVAKLNNESQWQIDTKIEIDEASVKAAAQQALDDTHQELITLRNVEERADVEFTHSVCPGCKDKLYPELAK